MSEVAKRLERLIQRINLLYGLIIPIIIGLVFGRVLNVINPHFFRTDHTATLIYYTVTLLGVAVLIGHYKTVGKLSRTLLGLVYVFYILALSALIVFIDPYPTPYYWQIIAALIAVDLVFGSKIQKLGIIYFSLILFTSYFRTSDEITAEGLTVTALYGVGAAVVAILVSKYRRISDQERSLLDESSKQSQLERQRLLSLINNMGEAVISTDDKGKIVLYNAAVLDLLDTNQSLDDKSIDTILRLKTRQGKRVKLTKLIKDDKVGLTFTDYLHEFSPGDAINLYINVASVKVGFKQDVSDGYIIMMRDITKEKSLEEERDEFISVVSHELRTPAAVAEGNISNAIFALDKKADKKAIGSALQEAHDQVIFLANMINDLATLSRAERSDVKMEITTIKPDELLKTIGDEYAPDADGKGLKFTVTAAKDTKPIKSSELYMREVLQNFITNALKYTRKGSIVLHVRSNLSDEAVFSVADTGIGLSKSDQKHIFEKFYRSEDYRTRESSGTGLGLYVTAKLAHKLKAKISVESQLDKGSTFTITIPSLKK